MTVWFTSDLHFGHRLVADHRGFGTGPTATREHDAVLFGGWRERVRKDDDVWVLGDLAVSNPAYALYLIETLPGRKHLIAGNHDKCHPMHRDSHKHLRRYLEVFESVQPFARRRVRGREVLLSHFPYERDREEPRHTQYRLRDEGLPLMHGHTHGEEKLTVLHRVNGTSRVELHVGVDAWDLAPVPLDTVADLLETVDSGQPRA